jgi:hypothetical protein
MLAGGMPKGPCRSEKVTWTEETLIPERRCPQQREGSPVTEKEKVMTANEPPKLIECPRKAIGDLVNDIMQSISTNEPTAQIEDVGRNALWRDTRLLAHAICDDNGMPFTGVRLHQLLTES